LTCSSVTAVSLHDALPIFIPTHSSWLNQVERFFAKITTERIRRGVFRSIGELQEAIEDYIANHNQAPKPFRWTATADRILGKVRSEEHTSELQSRENLVCR